MKVNHNEREDDETRNKIRPHDTSVTCAFPPWEGRMVPRLVLNLV